MQSAYYEEIPYGDIEAQFSKLASLPGAAWLDSGSGPEQHGRYDIISAEPEVSIRGTVDEKQQLTGQGIGPSQDIFARLEAIRPSIATDNCPLPFCGGLIGYLGYDLNCQLEALQLPDLRATNAPDYFVGYYPWALVQDRLLRRAWLVCDSDRNQTLISKYKELLFADNSSCNNNDEDYFCLEQAFSSHFSRAEYLKQVQHIKDYILAGDCYQVNLAQCFSAAYSGSSWQAYRQLRQAVSAPFSSYINTGQGELLSISPERFLQIHDGHIETRPIKGTRARGSDPVSDQALANELLASEKDRAENLMIVDLLRNDLARSCRPGSIQVERLFELESYTNVHHLVSTISGELAPGVSPLQALRRAFPGGSITGAPKIRAMEIIAELEQLRRSAYCGSVFYLSNDNKMDSNIAIRSVIADDKKLCCWGGGGIVADSDPEAEFDESMTKIQALLDALKS
jgi:para-aminobenzoate synthetase component 1